MRWWFLLGSVVGGSTSGVLVGLVAMATPPLPVQLTIGIVGMVAILVLLRDIGFVAVPFPQNSRQVRQSVVRMQPAPGALVFGFELGTGFRTYMTGFAPYIVAAAALVASEHGPLPGLLAGVGFGLGRGLVPMDRALHGASEKWDSWVRRNAKRTLPVVGAVLTLLASAFVLSQ